MVKLAQNKFGSIAILKIARMHDSNQYQTDRIDKNVTLAAGNLLPGVIATVSAASFGCLDALRIDNAG